MQNPFPESVETIAELTGVAVSKRSLEEILPDAARDFDALYQQRPVATAEGGILVALDGKGGQAWRRSTPCTAQSSLWETFSPKKSRICGSLGCARWMNWWRIQVPNSNAGHSGATHCPQNKT